MAVRVRCKQKLFDQITDWVWPHLTGDEPHRPTDQDRFSSEHIESLDKASKIFQSCLVEEKERNNSVESRLMALLTLISVLSAVIAASLAAAATTLSMVKEDEKIFAFLAVILVFYVALQILCSLLAVVSGLMRSCYKNLSPNEIVPQGREASDVYQIRLLNLQVNNLCFNEWVINKRVGHMQVSLTALRNALIAIFPLVIVILVFAAFRLA